MNRSQHFFSPPQARTRSVALFFSNVMRLHSSRSTCDHTTANDIWSVIFAPVFTVRSPGGIPLWRLTQKVVQSSVAAGKCVARPLVPCAEVSVSKS